MSCENNSLKISMAFFPGQRQKVKKNPTLKITFKTMK